MQRKAEGWDCRVNHIRLRVLTTFSLGQQEVIPEERMSLRRGKPTSSPSVGILEEFHFLKESLPRAAMTMNSYPSNLNTGYVLLLSSGMGTLVGMFEGYRHVGFMLALLPWHWLI
ncbi:hypothetical protein H5410_021666 [Solanum commersonii]|uniref:Uncharacterized protein n=1 Tax=Solanum commersonii TaxID=4109 RepID=A0A9J5ZBZ1_SOLCO|nr:hypothetical protein H5410_021666 [Solanum commersonii]